MNEMHFCSLIFGIENTTGFISMEWIFNQLYKPNVVR